MARRKHARSTSPSDTVRNVHTKETAFAERYDTANNTNEQVLSELSFIRARCLCIILLTWQFILQNYK